VFQRLLSQAVFDCERCDIRFHVRKRFFSIFGRYAECPECGTRDLSRPIKRDRIDRMTRNPGRLVLAIAGCSLYHCRFCRFQFRDWRKIDPLYSK